VYRQHSREPRAAPIGRTASGFPGLPPPPPRRPRPVAAPAGRIHGARLQKLRSILAHRQNKTPPEQWEAFKLGAGAGFEPATANSQSSMNQCNCVSVPKGSSQLDAQDTSTACQELAFIVSAWPKLERKLRNAILVTIRIPRLPR
jgi:hypothetical protein